MYQPLCLKIICFHFCHVQDGKDLSFVYYLRLEGLKESVFFILSSFLQHLTFKGPFQKSRHFIILLPSAKIFKLFSFFFLNSRSETATGTSLTSWPKYAVLALRPPSYPQVGDVPNKYVFSSILNIFLWIK